MSNGNFDTGKFDAIQNGSGRELGEALQHLVKKIDANGTSKKNDSIKMIVSVTVIVLTLLGMLWSFSGWKKSTDMRNTQIEEKVETHCIKAEVECTKVWDRFETDRKDRQNIKDNVVEIKHDISTINTSQHRVEADIKEIKEAVKN